MNGPRRHSPTASGLPEWQVEKIMEARVGVWLERKHHQAIAVARRSRVKALARSWSARRRKHAA